MAVRLDEVVHFVEVSLALACFVWLVTCRLVADQWDVFEPRWAISPAKGAKAAITCPAWGVAQKPALDLVLFFNVGIKCRLLACFD